MESTTSPKSEGPTSHKLGWIGAGKMGAPMIRNLLAHRQTVSVTEPQAGALDALVDAGAARAASLSEHAGADIVFSTLPNDAALTEVVFGTHAHPGLAETLDRGATFVEMSTVSPDCSAQVADALGKAGIHYLRAAISGSTVLAEKAALTLLTSGDEPARDMARPYLEMMSAKHFYLGGGDEARYMKLVVNAMVGATSAILAEALTVGVKGGLSRADMMDVICESAVASPLLNYKRDAVVNDDYTPAFSLDQMVKDFTLLSDAARSKNVPLMTNGLILELYRAASNAGLKDADFFALVKWHADMSSS